MAAIAVAALSALSMTAACGATNDDTAQAASQSSMKKDSATSGLVVFAPVDRAFAKLPKKTVISLAQPKNAELLKTVLTYHVVPGRIAPDQIAGEHATVEGAKVDV